MVPEASESITAGRHINKWQAWPQEVESSHLRLQVQSRKRELGTVWGFEPPGPAAGTCFLHQGSTSPQHRQLETKCSHRRACGRTFSFQPLHSSSQVTRTPSVSAASCTVMSEGNRPLHPFYLMGSTSGLLFPEDDGAVVLRDTGVTFLVDPYGWFFFISLFQVISSACLLSMCLVFPRPMCFPSTCTYLCFA